MRQAVIVDIVRTASGKGKPGGALSGVHPVDLYATVLRALAERNNLDPGGSRTSSPAASARPASRR